MYGVGPSGTQHFCSLFSDNKNRCPICYRHLKSWPARLGAEFVCMSPHRCTGPNADGSGKRATRNLTGDDRLTCFNCDFDMCRFVSMESYSKFGYCVTSTV